MQRDVQRHASKHSGRTDFAAGEKELFDFLENAPHAIDSIDVNGRILWANQFELALLGYAPDEYIGHDLAEFHADAGMFANILDRIKQGVTLTEEPARLLCKDGSIRDVLITSNVRYEGGKLVYSRCFTRDVTDQQRAVQGLDYRA